MFYRHIPLLWTGCFFGDRPAQALLLEERVQNLRSEPRLRAETAERHHLPLCSRRPAEEKQSLRQVRSLWGLFSLAEAPIGRTEIVRRHTEGTREDAQQLKIRVPYPPLDPADEIGRTGNPLCQFPLLSARLFQPCCSPAGGEGTSGVKPLPDLIHLVRDASACMSRSSSLSPMASAPTD